MTASRFFSAALLLTSAGAYAQQFVPGDLAVLRAGDGVATLASTGNSVFIDQFSTSGALVNSVAMPSGSGTAGYTINGTATAEGGLALSADGQSLTFSLYNRGQGGVGTVNSQTASSVPRVVGVVDFSRNFSVGASSTATVLDGISMRSAVSDGNNNFWGMGNGGTTVGTYYFGNTAGANMIQTTYTVSRVENIVNGNIYFTQSGSAGAKGIYGFSGMPTSSSTPTLVLATGTSSSPYDFAFNSANTIAYVADDSAVGTGGGGIQRWDWNGSAWVLSYTLATGASGSLGARGLAVDFSGANPLIYATTAETSANRLISIVDTGSGSAFTTLSTAPTKEIYRGLEFVPVSVPEPAAAGLLGLGVGGMLFARRRRK